MKDRDGKATNILPAISALIQKLVCEGWCEREYEG